MCGRYFCNLDPKVIISETNTHIEEWIDRDLYTPTYNVHPGCYSPVLMSDSEGHRYIQTMKWGLIPSTTSQSITKPNHFSMFNSRAESLPTNSLYKRLMTRQRCIILINGYFEWRTEGNKKQPYYIHFQENQPIMYLAGLYDCWKDSEGHSLYSFTIITHDASKNLQYVHSRMPMILEQQSMDSWLQNTTNLSSLYSLYKKPLGLSLIYHPISSLINKLTYNEKDCILPIKRQTIQSFFKVTDKKDEEEINKEKPKGIKRFFCSDAEQNAKQSKKQE